MKSSSRSEGWAYLKSIGSLRGDGAVAFEDVDCAWREERRLEQKAPKVTAEQKCNA